MNRFKNGILYLEPMDGGTTIEVPFRATQAEAVQELLLRMTDAGWPEPLTGERE